MAEYTRVQSIDLQKYLNDVNYPVIKDQLIETASNHGADAEIIAALQNLPDREYNSPMDVSEALSA